MKKSVLAKHIRDHQVREARQGFTFFGDKSKLDPVMKLHSNTIGDTIRDNDIAACLFNEQLLFSSPSTYSTAVDILNEIGIDHDVWSKFLRSTGKRFGLTDAIFQAMLECSQAGDPAMAADVYLKPLDNQMDTRLLLGM